MPRPERALDGEDTALTRFALDLRALRDGIGRPGYRVLAELTDYSISTLSEAASGRSLPTLAVTVAYVQACSGDTVEWERRWHQVAAELAAESAPESDAEQGAETTPYVGLAAFETADSHRFFGREKLVADLVERVGRQRFVAVFGASGAGKSSILRAGLVAAWTAQGKPSALFTPGAQPMSAYDAALASLGSGPRDMLLVVDQFEEVFTLCQDETERDLFLDRLLADARRDDSRLRVVIGVRTDFYGHCADDAGLAEALQDSQFLVGPMTPDQLRSAITRPAVLAGGSVETSLLAAVIADCSGQPGVLPLLSHALRETWRRRSGSRMTLDGYQAAGGITHAIAQTAEQTYDELDSRGRQLAKSLFLRLTALGDGTGDTKRRVDTAEVDGTDPNLAAVLGRLTDARLVTVDGGHIEISHEALIRCWPRLSEWLVSDRQSLQAHRQLTEAANQWNLLHRDRGTLYRGMRLSAAQELADGPIELSKAERDFLAASTDEENQQATVARKRTNRLRSLVSLLSVLLVVAGTLSVIAVRAQNAAQTAQQAITLQRNQTLAEGMLGQAAGLSASDPATAGQLSLAAYRLAPSAQARSMVLQTAGSLHAFTASIQDDGFLLGLSPDGRLAAINDVVTINMYALDSATHTVHQVGTIPIGAPGTVPTAESATFSPDHKLMMIDYMDSAPKLYDTGDPAHPKLLAAMPAQGGSIAYFGSDRYLITESTFLTVWDLVDPSHPKPISTIKPPSSLAGSTDNFVLSPDGRTAAEVIDGPQGDVIRVADVSKPQAQITFSVTVAGEELGPIALSHGVLAFASDTGTIYLWRVSNPHGVVGLGTIQVKTLGFGSVVVSPDGTELAVSMGINTVAAWDLTSAGGPHQFASITYASNELPTSMLGFQTDRTLVGQIGNGGPGPGRAVWVTLPAPSLSASNGSVADPSFSPDGTTLSVSFESTVNGAGTQLWNVEDPSATTLRTTLRGSIIHPIKSDNPALYDTGVGRAIFAPTGHLLVTSDGAHGRLWDATNPDQPRMLSVVQGDPMLFSPDARTLASSDGQFWDVSDPSHPKQIPGLPKGFYGGSTATLSPDGRLFATSDTSKITLYQLGAAGKPKVAGTINYPASQVAFAANSRTLAAASYGGRVGFWNLSNPAKPVLLSTLEGRKGGNTGLVFSPNGHYVAIPENDGSTQIWNVQDPRHPTSFVVLDDATPLAFDPNGKVIAVYAADGSLQLRQIDVTAAIKQLCAGTPTISRKTWSQYAPTLPYQSPCSTPPSRP